MAKQKKIKNKKLSLRNLDFKKNWKKLSFSGALALLLITSVGFAGYTYLEQRNLEAQAAGYTTLGWSNRLMRVCKYSNGTSSVGFKYFLSNWTSNTYSSVVTSGLYRAPITVRNNSNSAIYYIGGYNHPLSASVKFEVIGVLSQPIAASNITTCG